MENQRPCPSCESTDADLIGDKNGFQMLECRLCRTIFTFQLPGQSEAQNYDSYYPKIDLSLPDIIHERLGEIVGDFKTFRKNNRMLDIGFGSAILMQIARKKGWQVNGLEISAPAIENAQKLGFEVFKGELAEAGFPDDHFDVVMASEILEHLSEPQKILKEIARILRPGGLLWGTTPSCRGMSYRLMKLGWTVVSPPEHIQLFSVKGMRVMLEKAGFSNVDLRTYNLDPMEIIQHFRRSANENGDEFDRVTSSYQLNESLTKNRTRKTIKSLLNGTLNKLQIGDSLKIYAQK